MRFKIPTLFAITFLITSLVAGCGGADEAIDEMPGWMTEKPQVENHLIGTGTAVSGGMQMSMSKAETRARNDIASTVEVRVQSLTKDFQEEVSGEMRSQFTQAQKQVVSQVISGSSTRETEVVEQDDKYRAYVMMEMPIGKASKELISKIKSNEELYTQFRASEAFEQLQEEVEKYKKSQDGTVKRDSTQEN